MWLAPSRECGGMATVSTKPITAAEFAQLPDPADGSQMELVRGEVVLMPPPKGRHGVVCGNVALFLGHHIKSKKLGWLTCNDSGVILERDPDTVRGPDVAFWSIERQPEVPEGYFEIPPDFAVEVLSPDDRRVKVREKIREYLANGVKVVWLVDPELRVVTVYPGTMRGVELDTTEQLDGGDVLPGFSCPVADLFV
jgi:Uma2 family endonuclease